MYKHLLKHKVTTFTRIFQLVKEELFYNIWKYKLFNTRQLLTTQGETVDILFSGDQNKNSGPDFSNARIKIGGTEWAGSVEVHVKSADWLQHGHQTDKAYKNVILHVVYEDDKEINNTVPVLELKGKIAAHTINAYLNIIEDRHPIPCHALLPRADHFTWLNWLDRLTAERLQTKVNSLNDVLTKNNNHWEDAFYQLLAHYLGGKVNNEAMTQLAIQLPLSVLAKHKHNIMQVEALMYGTAGFLAQDNDDSYFKELKSEFAFLKLKYNLNEMSVSAWKFMRMRPANFPTIRIAQLAMLVHQSSHLLSKLLETEDIRIAIRFFDVTPSAYWETHYQFGDESVKKSKILGTATVNALMINTIIPTVFYYARLHGMPKLEERAIKWLSTLKAENNNIVALWKNLGKKPANAADTQAMLHLYNHYCKPKKCLNCAIGIALLRNTEN